MPKTIQSKLLRFLIPSQLGQAHRVLQQVQKELEQQGYAGQNLFALRLALEEALVNAIKHGNRLDKTKKVKVQVEISPVNVRIMVEDQGPGFDRKKVPDPRLEENLTKCTGRGILLIESYMDSVKWSKSGRCLEMRRKTQADTLPRSKP